MGLPIWQRPTTPLPPAQPSPTFGFGLHTTFNEPNGVELMSNVRGFGFTHSRIEVQYCPDPIIAKQCQTEAALAGLTSLCIVSPQTATWVIEDVEVGNEPDINGVSADNYINMVNAVVEARRDMVGDIYAGVISNLSVKALSYLRGIIDRLPPQVKISAHRYAEGKTGAPTVPHPGFISRDDEVAEFRRIIGPRDWIITEFGYSNLYRTEQETAADIAWEWNFWRNSGVKAAYLYQLNDADSSNELAHYGIRRTNGTWKPAAEVIPKSKYR